MTNNPLSVLEPALRGVLITRDDEEAFSVARPDRKNTETLQFAFLHSPDGHPVCGVIPLIVGESEDTAKATCDELAAYRGGALVRQLR